MDKKVLREVTDKLLIKVKTRKEFLKEVITTNINQISKVEFIKKAKGKFIVS